MDIIQSFIEKYDGIYHEEEEKSLHTTIGKYSSQEKSGSTIYKGNKISVSIIESGGANPVAELFRMKLILDYPVTAELLIFPRSYWSQKLRTIFAGKNSSLNKTIYHQYCFTGSRELLTNLRLNEPFLNNIEGEYVCINHSKKRPNVIIITPSHGYRSLEHLEKLAEILIMVKTIIGSGSN